jgi:hypothetical protein
MQEGDNHSGLPLAARIRIITVKGELQGPRLS